MKKPTSKLVDEKTFKRYICWILEMQGFDTQEHEDKLRVGVPDVSYGADGINGWIEFKWVTGKLRASQVNWLAKRVLTGGHCFVIRGWSSHLEITDCREWRPLGEIARHQWSDQLPSLLLQDHHQIRTEAQRLHQVLEQQDPEQNRDTIGP